MTAGGLCICVNTSFTLTYQLKYVFWLSPPLSFSIIVSSLARFFGTVYSERGQRLGESLCGSVEKSEYDRVDRVDRPDSGLARPDSVTVLRSLHLRNRVSD